MKRTTGRALRTGVVLLLGAAIFDLPLPARSRARTRVHLVDRSESVLVPGPPESLTPADAARIIQWDRAAASAGDSILWASFARGVAFESARVDPDGTELEGALEAALARNPTEIVLHSDGRADAGRAALLARARGVPVHAFRLGPLSVRDARLVRIAAHPPASIEVTVEATYDGTLRLRVNDQAAEVPVVARAPVRVPFALPGPGRFTVRIENPDDCPRNNEAVGEIFQDAARRPVLLLSATPREVPGYDVTVSRSLRTPAPFDAVILDNVPLSEAEQRSLADYVERFGGSLLLLGGPQSHASGGWQGTPLEALSPLWARPFGDAAIAFVVDASGSMEQDHKLETVLRAVTAGVSGLRRKDKWAVVAFSDGARVYTDRESLREIRASGATHALRGLNAARQWLENTAADRKHILLLTDGETKETPAELETGARALGEIGLTVVTTARPLPIGKNFHVDDWRALEARMDSLLRESDDLVDAKPQPIRFREHPAVAGLAAEAPPRLNRTSAKEDAQVAATSGELPAVAFRQAGRGRVGAFAFGFDFLRERLLRQSLDYLVGDAGGGLTLSVEPPVVRARGTAPPRFEADYQVSPSGASGTVVMDQVGSSAWEGRLPRVPAGTVFVKFGRARASATVACPPELESLGVDSDRLGKLAAQTGGRVLESLQDLAALPRPSVAGRRSGRAAFLAAALALFLLDLALSTFWKD